ncbi:MAG: HD-GYP domain-containing protein [Sulfurifustaceae bacterium]
MKNVNSLGLPDQPMRKKIDVRDLQLGMYVAELDRPWLETPFLFQGFELREHDTMSKLRELCKYVWIETDSGKDYVPPARGGRAAIERMQKLAQEDEAIRQKIRNLTTEAITRHTRPPYQDQTSFEQELTQAKGIHVDARDVLHQTMRDVQRGKPIDIQLARKVVNRMVDSILRNPDALVCLSQLKEVSEYTALHSVRSAILALTFGRHLALPREDLNILGIGALLHDIGMARVPAEILAKKGALSEKEFETMTKHAVWGLEIARTSGAVPPAALDLIAHHHERADGSGYPLKRKQNAISPSGYIGAIVDVYDAITSDRIYDTGLSAEDALRRMYEWREKDFDAPLVEDFIRCMGIFPIGSLVELSTGSVGVVITINRARRLKPKIALVLTASKTPYSTRMVTDLMEHTDGQGQEIKITRVLPSGTYGINPMQYIVQL